MMRPWRVSSSSLSEISLMTTRVEENEMSRAMPNCAIVSKRSGKQRSREGWMTGQRRLKGRWPW